MLALWHELDVRGDDISHAAAIPGDGQGLRCNLGHDISILIDT